MNIHWRSVGLTVAVLAVLAILAGAATVAFGLYNVSARLGHITGVGWLLHTTFRNSVDLYTDETREVPDTLGHPGMIALGARHYEAACRTCHAAPGAMRTATARALLPAPPHLEDAVRHWTPREFHWIVHEGVKMSGMPGWPVAREEEVWPIVAFLLAVRDGMSPFDYEDLTRLQRDDPNGIGLCRSCHGEDGARPNPFVPRLDIQSESYIATALRAYRDGTRKSGIMQHAASAVPETVLTRAAAEYGKAAPDVAQTPAPLSALAREGRDLAYANPGNAAKGPPACRACHGPWAEPLSPLFPSLAGQHEPYLATQLRLWRKEMRGGGPAEELMHEAARGLTDAEIDALAAYYAALPPAKLNAVEDPGR